MKKKKLVLLITAITLNLSAIKLTNAEIIQVPILNIQEQMNVLAKGNWSQFNHAQLNTFILENGKQSAKYNAEKPPYVIFDFDNTSVFLDIEEATLIYQLENLLFKVKPKELNKIIRTNIAETNFSEDYQNKDGQPVNINTIAPDIIESYTWLYKNYVGLKGKKSLDEVKQNPHYYNFITKMRYLYAAIGDTFDHSVSYPWVTYLFAGYTPQEVSQLAKVTYKWQQQQSIGPVTWISPQELAGKAGVVSVTWENGLRPYKDVQNLYHTLMNNGFDVYVCSASFIDVIKGVVTDSDIGFNVPEDHIFAMQLQHDKNNKIVAQFNHDYFQTQGKGKSQTIQKFLLPKYGYGPVFIAGDSEGDQNMMQDFSDTQKVLIVNRWRNPTTDIGRLSKLAVETQGKSNAKYLLQGRNANTGEFIPSQKSIAFGTDEAKTFK
jgi:hypothetical protein